MQEAITELFQKHNPSKLLKKGHLAGLLEKYGPTELLRKARNRPPQHPNTPTLAF